MLRAAAYVDNMLASVEIAAGVGTNVSSPLLSVVIPVFNERSTIKEVIYRVQAVPVEKEIIVVDDGSTDGTRELLVEMARSATPNAGGTHEICHIRYFFQAENRGKGAALRRGFGEARGKLLLVQDADLELNPDEYPALIEPLVSGVADVVYGSRFLGKGAGTMPFRYHLANKILTVSSNLLTSLSLTDVWTGYKAFRREVIESIELHENRFGFEPEFTAKVASKGYRVREVPVDYENRSIQEGKKIRLRDGVKGMWSTVRYSLFD